MTQRDPLLAADKVNEVTKKAGDFGVTRRGKITIS